MEPSYVVFRKHALLSYSFTLVFLALVFFFSESHLLHGNFCEVTVTYVIADEFENYWHLSVNSIATVISISSDLILFMFHFFWKGSLPLSGGSSDDSLACYLQCPSE